VEESSLNWIWVVVVIAAIGAVSYFSYTRAKNRRAELGRHRPGELVPLIGTAKGFRDQIPRLVWSQYGIEPRNSTERSLP
jgi:hypothetical protein